MDRRLQVQIVPLDLKQPLTLKEGSLLMKKSEKSQVFQITENKESFVLKMKKQTPPESQRHWSHIRIGAADTIG